MHQSTNLRMTGASVSGILVIFPYIFIYADILRLSEGPVDFEDFKQQEGITYWWASHLMSMLGYKDMASFKKAIDWAMRACISMNIDCLDNFTKAKSQKGPARKNYLGFS